MCVLSAWRLLVMATYFYGYTTPSYHPPLWNALRHPIRLPLYVLCYLGQPVFNFHKLGAACMGPAGGCVVGGAVYIVYGDTREGIPRCYGIA